MKAAGYSLRTIDSARAAAAASLVNLALVVLIIGFTPGALT